MVALNKAVENWIINRTPDKRGLYLFGGVGVGKTYNLKELYQRITKKVRGKTRAVIFENSGDYLEKLGKLRVKSYNDRSNFSFYNQQIESLLSGKRIFILDDLGSETITEKRLEDLYTVINRMYERKTTLIIASNLSPSELEKKLGDRICSRIFGMCEVIELQGNDRRLE